MKKHYSIPILIIAIVFGIIFLARNGKVPGSISSNTQEVSSQESEENTKTSQIEEQVTKKTTTTNTKPSPSQTSTQSSYHSYANAVYGFTMKYPSFVKVRDGFFPFYQLGSQWRMYPSIANQGKAVVSFNIYTVDQGSYRTGKEFFPLFFTSEVRVGVSDNTKSCYEADQGYTDQQPLSVTLGGVPFKKFTSGDAAMMKYVRVESYRTIHNGKCFVLEQIKNGSNYKDVEMKPGISEVKLGEYYNLGETIIKTFRFTN